LAEFWVSEVKHEDCAGMERKKVIEDVEE